MRLKFVKIYLLFIIKVLILINVLILRFKVVLLADIDALLLTYGTIVGYIIIVSAIIANYILGANLSYLELIVNGLGIILFIAVGGVAFSHENSKKILYKV